LRYGDTSDQYAESIAFDPFSGNWVIAGTFAGVLDFSGGVPGASLGLSDVFLAAFGPGGGLKLAKSYGTANNQFGASVAVDVAGNIALSASVGVDMNFGGGVMAASDGIAVAKLDGLGNQIWAHAYGTGFTSAASGVVAFGPSGQVALAGGYGGTIDF